MTEGNREDTFVVYEGENYYGIVTYDSVLHPKEEEDGYIIKEKYIHKFNHGGIWNDIKEKLQKIGSSRAIIPIFNEKEEMLYFAYDEKIEGIENQNY
ncbi:MAG: hypothetical protein IJA34_07070 [Lachnospiraceae bacterium]|nr:hypothetical protein [Lachnospiraceae bacterium]